MDREETWIWRAKSNLKPETGAPICTALDQAIRATYIKHIIDMEL